MVITFMHWSYHSSLASRSANQAYWWLIRTSLQSKWRQGSFRLSRAFPFIPIGKPQCFPHEQGEDGERWQPWRIEEPLASKPGETRRLCLAVVFQSLQVSHISCCNSMQGCGRPFWLTPCQVKQLKIFCLLRHPTEIFTEPCEWFYKFDFMRDL